MHCACITYDDTITQSRKGAPGPAVFMGRSSFNSSSQENKEPKHQHSICHTNQLLSQNAKNIGAGSKRRMPQFQDLSSPCLTFTTRVTTCQSRTLKPSSSPYFSTKGERQFNADARGNAATTTLAWLYHLLSRALTHSLIPPRSPQKSKTSHTHHLLPAVSNFYHPLPPVLNPSPKPQPQQQYHTK
jgi:hypothetical protein